MVLLVTIAASMSRAVSVVAFYANQDTISQTLCENRNLPTKHCNGKCYLGKQLKEDDKKEKHSMPFSANEIFQEFIGTKYPLFHFPVNMNSEVQNYTSFYSFAYSHTYFSEIAHPPSI